MVRTLVVGLSAWMIVSCLAGVVIGRFLSFCGRYDRLAVDQPASDSVGFELEPAA
jgi:hypothetical protein